MVRFGTNTQKSNEPAWQDVGANVLRMDSLYDASFHDWLKCEDNVSIIASYLQRIANEYPMDRIINALRWLVSSWRLESTAVIVRHITADWAVPQNPPPKPNTSSSSFLMDGSHSSLQSDPSVLSGEARRGVLVRELTKDWTCQQIAQLVGMLSLTFWSERSHLEAFLKTLVSDWDFCRLSSFFSYVSGQLGLDYRVKVAMLQQAARRNASRLSLKRARNGGTSRANKVNDKEAASRKENAEQEQEEEDCSKRARHESSEYAAVSTSCNGSGNGAAAANGGSHNAEQVANGRLAVTALESSASSSQSNNSSSMAQALSSSSSSSSTAEASSVASSSAALASSSDELLTPVRTGSSSAPSARAATSFSARAFRSGHMPAPLCTGGRASSSHLRQPAAAEAAAAGPATTPSSPAVPNAPVSPPATASVHGFMASQPAETTSLPMDIDTEEIQSCSSSTDLASMSYTRSQSSQQQQQRRRSRNNTSGASIAATSASSPLVAGASSCISSSSSSSSGGVEPAQQASSPEASTSASAPESATAASPSMSARRPLTPQITSGVFIVGSEGHQQSSSPSLRRQHRHNRSYQRHDCQQPLTPTHSASSLSLMSGVSAQDVSAQPGASSASSLPTRPTMRIHAASISTTSADSSSLLAAAASTTNSNSSLSGMGSSGSSSSHRQNQQDLQQGQAQEFRARTASESELGQFDGPASTHLALPLPSESTANASSLCGRTSAAPYDVLGIVMSSETEHHQLAGSSRTLSPKSTRSMDSAAQPTAASTQQQQQGASSGNGDFKEFSVKVRDDLSDEAEAEVKKNIEKSISDAGGSFTWSELIKTYIVKMPVASSPNEVSIANVSALKMHLNQSVKSGIEFVDEEGMLKTQD
ncbi:hypothetical protein LPJ64_004317 [Coemansia asiatica]|uniref:Uncharacterized protein n=1 Tax=Coemansia asiatica TaxID=1052880 RepID=A0A9W7XGC8_9FUNG|nr:hypothetical protein LPJ64_004317 [Coemansia asiatica]